MEVWICCAGQIYREQTHNYIECLVTDLLFLPEAGQGRSWLWAIDLVILVYTNKQMLVGVYLDPRGSSTTSKSAESGKYFYGPLFLFNK